MIEPEDIRIEHYDYELPESKIAAFPSEERGNSNLLVYRNGSISKESFKSLSQFLPKNSTLVFNNTKVIRARLLFVKPTGAGIELFLLEPFEPSEYQKNFEAKGSCQWLCLVGNAKKWKNTELSMSICSSAETIFFQAKKIEEKDGKYLIRFTWNSTRSFAEVLDLAGKIPLPPYIHREVNDEDSKRYQTVYSRVEGSVAAPTAGLHFTEPILNELRQQGILLQELTLHVGIATFRPVSSATIGGHEMHTEHFILSLDLLRNLRESQTIIAVGTTSLRTLESIYWLALLLAKDSSCRYIPQWIAYKEEPSFTADQALDFLIDFLENHRLSFIEASTSILIVPGYSFKMINALVTNFHLPKSTLILLVAALVGDDWKEIYRYALNHSFQFLSYGDSSLLFGPTNLKSI